MTSRELFSGDEEEGYKSGNSSWNNDSVDAEKGVPDVVSLAKDTTGGANGGKVGSNEDSAEETAGTVEEDGSSGADMGMDDVDNRDSGHADQSGSEKAGSGSGAVEAKAGTGLVSNETALEGLRGDGALAGLDATEGFLFSKTLRGGVSAGPSSP